MKSLSRRRSPYAVFLFLVLLAVAANAEPVRVENGATAAEGLVTARLVEQWRAGGEDDEIFFGNVNQTATDAAGNVLLLDSQLSEVHVYAPDGGHLRTVGREGDGPGEVRNPNGFLVMKDGDVCVLPGFGGRLVMLKSDGLPGTDGAFTPAAGSGQFSVLIRGLPHRDGMVLAGIKMSFAGGVSTQTYFVSSCDAAGVEQATLCQKENTIDYADFVMSEAANDWVWSRLAVGPDDHVYAAPERNEYAIHVWDAAGEPERIITRAYEPRLRDDEEREIARKIFEGIAANYPSPPREIVIEDLEVDLAGMWVRDDGTLWVQTSRGNVAPPDGTWTVLDVFDTEGTFVRQVALAGDHDALRDGLHLLPDGRAVVVIGALDAFLSQQAVGGEEAEEAEQLEVICYTLEM